jgi:hypothetical protein
MLYKNKVHHFLMSVTFLLALVSIDSYATSDVPEGQVCAQGITGMGYELLMTNITRDKDDPISVMVWQKKYLNAKKGDIITYQPVGLVGELVRFKVGDGSEELPLGTGIKLWGPIWNPGWQRMNCN